MTVSIDQKVDLLYKQAFGVTKTDNATNKSASNEAIVAPAIVRGDAIWSQSDQIPGIAAGVRPSKESVDPAVSGAVTSASVLPTTEFNPDDPKISIDENFYFNPKPVHKEQFKNLLQQGLDKDAVRGTVTSSSQREAPSSVFGISTPGRYEIGRAHV